MQQLPDALAPMAAFRQFIIYKLIPAVPKTKKIPLDPATLQAFSKDDNWQRDPSKWVDAQTACAVATACGSDYGVGFILQPTDPFFFLDIDGALQADNTWSPLASGLCNRFAGAAIEVSQSNTGLHIIGRGTCPPHSCRRDSLGLELYTEYRFIALTGTSALGSADADCTAALAATVPEYFPLGAGGAGPQEWTTEPVPEWNGPTDDDELIAKALNAKLSAAAMFGDVASFSDLWNANVEALAVAYPDEGGQVRHYNESGADLALAHKLAFWTGKDCERILRLMKRSALVREKWDREDYLPRTIERAVALQADVYNSTPPAADNTRADEQGAPRLRANSDAQRALAESVRAQRLAECGDDADLAFKLAQGGKTAQFWLNNRDRTVAELGALLTPLESVPRPFAASGEPVVVSGFQFMPADLQIEHFKGCVYLQDQHKVFTPTGAILKEGPFNATYGGYLFQLDDGGEKTTKKAWEAFTESQVVRFPKAETTAFRPDMVPGEVFQQEGRQVVNVYVPVTVRRIPGDASPFLGHLQRVLPDERDRAILLAYMAACVQFPGVKFQWAPLVQGAQGNGKTLFSRCVAYAVGECYTHMPPANEISEKFNDWLFNKLFIGVEDVYVPEHKKEVIEVLKPMITNDRLSKRAMQQSQIMGDNRANFILNSNHKDAIRKTRDDRRFAVFYSAQQSVDDINRDGMGGDYFPRLYDWLKADGYAVVAGFLEQYEIPDELNPAGALHRAPETTSTGEAVSASLGTVEQEIMEAIEEGRPGFAGGWISSFALDRLLHAHRMNKAIPPNRRRDMLIQLGYDWHPGLKDGRVNNPTLTDGGKARLFIKLGHIHANLTSPAEIVKVYDAAQTTTPGGITQAEALFGDDNNDD